MTRRMPRYRYHQRVSAPPADPTLNQFVTAPPLKAQLRRRSAYHAKMSTAENLAARVAAMEITLAEALTVIQTIGATQSVLGDALREYAARMRGAEALAQDSNQRIRSLEASVAELRNLLARPLER
jgi:hypothetical protein